MQKELQKPFLSRCGLTLTQFKTKPLWICKIQRGRYLDMCCNMFQLAHFSHWVFRHFWRKMRRLSWKLPSFGNCWRFQSFIYCTLAVTIMPLSSSRFLTYYPSSAQTFSHSCGQAMRINPSKPFIIVLGITRGSDVRFAMPTSSGWLFNVKRSGGHSRLEYSPRASNWKSILLSILKSSTLLLRSSFAPTVGSWWRWQAHAVTGWIGATIDSHQMGHEDHGFHSNFHSNSGFSPSNPGD